MKIILIFFLTIYPSFLIGQEDLNASKIDEFGAITCDDFLARADNFFKQLMSNPTSTGYFVLSGRNELLKGKLFWEEQMNHAIIFRKPANQKINIIRGPELGDFKAQMWIIPDRAPVPDFHSTPWNFLLPPGTKQFMLTSEFSEMCDFPAKPELINDYLNANPGMYLKVVIYARTLKQRRYALKEAREALSSLSENRVHYFYKKLPRDYSDSRKEYWLVPHRN